MALTNATLNNKSTSINPIFFPANIVGMIRVGILFILFWTFHTKPVCSMLLYSLTLLFDGVDGYLARRLNQTTAFGRILDMVTDRASIALLLLVLSQLYAAFWGLFALLLLLDLSSHMAIIYSTAIEQKLSHKQTLLMSHGLLRAYYENRWVLSIVCATHDLGLCAIYCYYFFPSAGLLSLIALLSIGITFKTYIHLMQLYYAFKIVL